MMRQMVSQDYRARIVEYIEKNALPPDKFSHQARLYNLACILSEGQPFDDDVVFAAAWMHDLGVFIGHRPESPDELANWDHLSYTLERTPTILRECDFPIPKIPAVLEAIRTHMPQCEPTTFEGILIRDGDILEQLGGVGILRTVSKVGRDTRFIRFSDAIRVLERNLEQLPGKIRLDSARKLAESRMSDLRRFLDSCAENSRGLPW